MQQECLGEVTHTIYTQLCGLGKLISSNENIVLYLSNSNAVKDKHWQY